MSTNEYTQIGWIGLGQMGNPMVTRLLNAGIEVGVHGERAVAGQTVGIELEVLGRAAEYN